MLLSPVLLHTSDDRVTVEALRLEAQEQARKAVEEEKRQQLTQLQTEQEDTRLTSERSQKLCLCKLLFRL